MYMLYCNKLHGEPSVRALMSACYKCCALMLVPGLVFVLCLQKRAFFFLGATKLHSGKRVWCLKLTPDGPERKNEEEKYGKIIWMI